MRLGSSYGKLHLICRTCVKAGCRAICNPNIGGEKEDRRSLGPRGPDNLVADSYRNSQYPISKNYIENNKGRHLPLTSDPHRCMPG